MIVLYGFGPYFGLPDPSPFVMKAMVLLKMANLEFRVETSGLSKAPKGKLPYIEDDGKVIADSTFIRWHIENKYGFDFDTALNAEQRALAWTLERMIEEHLYWVMVHERWCDDKNFKNGPAAFFDFVPAPVRPLIKSMIRRKVRGNLKAHGLGRHKNPEIAKLALRDVDALSTILGSKSFIMGDHVCGADASIFSMVAGFLIQGFSSPTGAAFAAHPNLVAYRDRMMGLYFPEFAKVK